MRVQWKTISKAFKDMNKDIHTDGISPNELKFYLNHWRPTDLKIKSLTTGDYRLKIKSLSTGHRD